MNKRDLEFIQSSRLKFDAISKSARERIYQIVLKHFQKNPASPWSGKPLLELEQSVKEFYSDMGWEYTEVFRDTLPATMQKYYDTAVSEMKKAGIRRNIVGKPDAQRIKYFMESSFEQVAMKTQKMSFDHIKQLRSIAADVTRQMSLTGNTRKEVSKAMLNKAMEIPSFQFTDNSGHKWQAKSYFDMLARTELMTAARASYDDKCAKEGFDVVELTYSGHSCDACNRWEGRLFSLTGATKGLPTKDDLIADGVFHPNCTHSYTLVPQAVFEEDFNPDGTPKTDPMRGIKKIQGYHSNKDDLEKTNPKYKRNDRRYTANCQRCVPTYEARRRGYDVEAMPRILDRRDETSEKWAEIFVNAEWYKCPSGVKDIDFVKDKMKEFGSGSRAEIYVKWPAAAGGHAHVFVAEHYNGQTFFYDPQPTPVLIDASSYFAVAEKGNTYISRIDNLEFSNYIKGCCKERGSK